MSFFTTSTAISPSAIFVSIVFLLVFDDQEDALDLVLILQEALIGEP